MRIFEGGGGRWWAGVFACVVIQGSRSCGRNGTALPIGEKSLLKFIDFTCRVLSIAWVLSLSNLFLYAIIHP